MITAREWRQLALATYHGSHMMLNDTPVIAVKTVLSLLSSFAEDGCKFELTPEGGVRLWWPEPPKPPEPPAPVFNFTCLKCKRGTDVLINEVCAKCNDSCAHCSRKGLEYNTGGWCKDCFAAEHNYDKGGSCIAPPCVGRMLIAAQARSTT